MIHPTAIIHKNAQIAPDVEIGPYAIIGENVTIAPGAAVGPHALVEFADIGENCRLHGHCAVGTAPQDLKYKNEVTKIIIGAGTVVREFAQMNRGTAAHETTVVGKNCMIMAFAHVAHDCIVGDNVIMVNCSTVGGHAEIGDNVVLGGLSAIHQFTKVGRLAMIGGGAMVTLDILPFTQVQGDRAKLFGLNLVGLKRKGYKLSAVEEIKSAYRTLFLSGLSQEEALDQLEATTPSDEVREMIAFIHASKRGICRPGRKETAEEM